MLFVDLTQGTIQEQALDEEMVKGFIGGYGIGARVLYNMMKPGIDPLGPDNILGFITGPLTGTGALFGGRYVVVCKSPVSGTWNDANSGGYFGPELKKAGYDAVFISGVSEKPVYLWITDGKAELRDASKYWGKDCTETQEALIEDIGEPKLRAALIGPAGENLSMIAAVINDLHRAAGRGGSGAVMGSKKLKAVVVRGTGKIPVLNPERIKEINKEILTAMKEGPMKDVVAGFGAFGTGVGTSSSILIGDTPIKNWGGVGITDIGEEGANKINTIEQARYITKKYACASCPMGCGSNYRVNEGQWPIGDTDRPEYETIGAFGASALNTDAESVIQCNDICNRSGLDTISTGATIAWAIECYENGLLTKEETGGIELTWGNAQAIVDMTEAIAKNEGFGKVLALGSAGAADKLGKGSEYLQTVRGIELPMHDPRNAPGFARTYQFDPTPGRHVKGGLGLGQMNNPDPAKYNSDNTGEADFQATIFGEVLDSAGLCTFLPLTGQMQAPFQYLEAVTGMEPQDIMSAGARILNMRQAFNVREGLKPVDFIMPSRSVGSPPLSQGPTANITIDNEKLGDNFYAAAGWDRKTGKPTLQVLEALGRMDDVIADLHN